MLNIFFTCFLSLFYFASADPGSTTITTNVYLTNDDLQTSKYLSTLVNQLPVSNKTQNNILVAMQ